MNLSKPEQHAAALLLRDNVMVRALPRSTPVLCRLETRGIADWSMVGGWAITMAGIAVAEKAEQDLRSQT